MTVSDLKLDAHWIHAAERSWELVLRLHNRGPKALTSSEVRSGALQGFTRPQASNCPFLWVVADGGAGDPGLLVLFGSLTETEQRECRLEFRLENAPSPIRLIAQAPGNTDPTPADA